MEVLRASYTACAPTQRHVGPLLNAVPIHYLLSQIYQKPPPQKEIYPPLKNSWELQNVPGITLFLKNTKQYNHFRYISFKIRRNVNYTLLPATVQVLETFQEAIL